MCHDDLMDQGHEQLALGNLEAARDSYKKAAEKCPEDPEAWHALAMTSLKLGDFETAVSSALRATEINPNEAMYWTSLSLAFVKQQKIPEAEAASARAKVISWGGKVAKGGWQGLGSPSAENSNSEK